MSIPSLFRIGNYAVFDRIAVGGMANVHFGRLLGPSSAPRAAALS